MGPSSVGSRALWGTERSEGGGQRAEFQLHGCLGHAALSRNFQMPGLSCLLSLSLYAVSFPATHHCPSTSTHSPTYLCPHPTYSTPASPVHSLLFVYLTMPLPSSPITSFIHPSVSSSPQPAIPHRFTHHQPFIHLHSFIPPLHPNVHSFPMHLPRDHVFSTGEAQPAQP